MNKQNLAGRMDRRTTLKLIGTAVPFVALAATPAEASKMSQQLAHYQNKPKNGRECDACKFFRKPHSCTVVSGTISREGWCMLWAK